MITDATAAGAAASSFEPDFVFPLENVTVAQGRDGLYLNKSKWNLRKKNFFIFVQPTQFTDSWFQWLNETESVRERRIEQNENIFSDVENTLQWTINDSENEKNKTKQKIKT